MHAAYSFLFMRVRTGLCLQATTDSYTHQSVLAAESKGRPFHSTLSNRIEITGAVHVGLRSSHENTHTKNVRTHKHLETHAYCMYKPKSAAHTWTCTTSQKQKRTARETSQPTTVTHASSQHTHTCTSVKISTVSTCSTHAVNKQSKIGLRLSAHACIHACQPLDRTNGVTSRTATSHMPCLPLYMARAAPSTAAADNATAEALELSSLVVSSSVSAAVKVL